MQAVKVPNPQPQSTDNAPNQQLDRSPPQSDRASRANRTPLAEPEPDATGAPDRAAKMRAVQQSARCANQPRSGGKFGKTKKQKKADAVADAVQSKMRRLQRSRGMQTRVMKEDKITPKDV